MNSPAHWKKRRPFFLLLIPLALAGLACLVMMLWNWLVPELFGLPKIQFWKALGLFALCRLLFGSFRFGGGPPPFVRERLKEKWNNMSEEERAAFKSKWRNRCGPSQEN